MYVPLFYCFQPKRSLTASVRDVLARRRSVDESAGAYLSPLQFQSMMVSAGAQEASGSSQSRRNLAAAASSSRRLDRAAVEDPNAISELLTADSIKQIKGNKSPKPRGDGEDDGLVFVVQDDRDSEIPSSAPGDAVIGSIVGYDPSVQVCRV